MLWGSDRTPDFLAWEFYRNTPWQFPLGIIENYSHPNVSSVGLTGSIPLLAIPFKLLNPILPEVFQYFGFWFFICYLLQGLFAVKLLKTLKVDNILYLVLGAAFFVISPVLIDRVDHMNLCSHWIILAAFYLYFNKTMTLKKKITYNALLVLFSALDHPYLILFTLGLGFAILFNEYFYNKKLKLTSFIGWNVFNVFLVLMTWYLVGNFIISGETAKGWGYGFYSSNLNSFFNSLGRTKLLPKLPTAQSGQYEGFAYLGFGVFLLLLYLFYERAQLKIHKGLYAIGGVSIALFIFSLSNKITFFGMSAEIPMPGIEKLGETFRATGRYVWALYYLIMLASIVYVYRLKVDPKYKFLAIVFCFAVQAIDVSPLMSRQYITHRAYKPPLSKTNWDYLIQNSDKVIMYPAYERNYDHHGDFMYFAHEVYLNNKAITAGHLARFDEQVRKDYAAYLEDLIANDQLDKEGKSFIVTTRKYMSKFQNLVNSGSLKLINMDNYIVLIPKHRTELLKYVQENQSIPEFQKPQEETLDSFLIRHKYRTVVLVAKDEASRNLCEEAKVILRDGGSKIDDLKYRGSYIGILHKNKMAYEEIGNDKFIARKFNQGHHEKHFIAKKEMYLESSGMDYGNTSKILIEGRDYSLRQRGLNVIVLNDDFEVVETTFFDTFEKCSALVLPNLF